MKQAMLVATLVLISNVAGSTRADEAATPAKPLPEILLVAGSSAEATGSSPACCANLEPCCDWCDTHGCRKHHGKLIGGVGLYLVQPFFDNNPGISFFIQNTGPGRRQDISHHVEVAPQLWLGWMADSGLGARARWWYFRQGTEETFTFADRSGPTLTVLSAAPLGSFIIQNDPQAFAITSKLQLQVGDLEVIQNAVWCKWNFLFCGGLSWVNITQNYNAFAVGPPGATVNPLFSGSSFAGSGPVLAVEARRPLGDGGMNLYASGRARLLFGTAHQAVFGGDELNGSQESRQNSVVAIEELELGCEYSIPVAQSRFFGQLALVGQEWLGAGNATRSTRGGPPTTIPNFSAEDVSGFGLYGVVFRLGFNY